MGRSWISVQGGGGKSNVINKADIVEADKCFVFRITYLLNGAETFLRS
jgi:hypothetical protein